MSGASEFELANLCGFLPTFLDNAVRDIRAQNQITEKVQQQLLTQLPEDDKVRLRDISAYMQYGGPLEHSRAALWEVYLWLQVGEEIGYFPRVECIDLMNHVSEMFPDYDSISQKVRSVFPGALQILLYDAFKRNKYFTRPNYPPFKIPESLWGPVQTVLILHANYFNDVSVRFLGAAIAFAREAPWSDLLKRDIDAELFAGEVTGERSSSIGNIENLVLGLLRTIGYIANYRDCFTGFRALMSESPDGGLLESDLRLLERGCKEISFWRLNFLTGFARDRFQELGKAFAAAVIKEGSKVDLTRFEMELSDLMDYWVRDVVMELRRTARL